MLCFTDKTNGRLCYNNPHSREAFPDLSEEAYLLHCKQKVFESAKEFGQIDSIDEIFELPDDLFPTTQAQREFRDAWVHDNGRIVEDLEKSKAIKLTQIRLEREPLMKELDTAFQRALEIGDEAERARVVAEKQKLRDVTEPLKDATIKSVDELRGKTLQDFLQG